MQASDRGTALSLTVMLAFIIMGRDVREPDGVSIPNVWITETTSWSKFCREILANHRIGEKDGFAFFPGTLKPTQPVNTRDDKIPSDVRRAYSDVRHGLSKRLKMSHADIDGGKATGTLERTNDNVTSVTALVLDFDKGADFDEVAEELRRRSLTFAIYSSYSHGNARTELAARQVQKFTGAGSPTDADVRRYLREHEGFVSAVANSAIVVDRRYDEGNKESGTPPALRLVVEHEPIHKFRVVLPLAKPFDATAYKDARTAANEWKRLYTTFAHVLDFPCDLSCATLCQAFYLPAHRDKPALAPRVDWHDGDLLDFEDADLQIDMENAAAELSKANKETRKSKSVSAVAKLASVERQAEREEWREQNPVSSAELEEVIKGLGHIDPDLDYPSWRNVIFAVASEFKDSDLEERALDALDEWSGQGEKYQGRKGVEDIWNAAQVGSGGVTMGTFWHHARAGGYRSIVEQLAHLQNLLKQFPPRRKR